jgi:hypothetical protein
VTARTVPMRESVGDREGLMRGGQLELHNEGVLRHDDPRRYIDHAEYHLHILHSSIGVSDDAEAGRPTITGTVRPLSGIPLMGDMTYVLVLAGCHELRITVAGPGPEYPITSVRSLTRRQPRV